MKINLKTKIRQETNGPANLEIGKLLETALWRSTGNPNARELYDKIQGKDEVDLTAKENASLQESIAGQYIAGVEWQLIDILEGKNGGS
jgi:hypothetical protein